MPTNSDYNQFCLINSPLWRKISIIIIIMVVSLCLGDKRANQHPALTALHVLWLRQHNRIVNELKRINQHWNGDLLYEEAK